MAKHLGDLEVAHGEAFGLAGINGAGKTTLLKCLLDLSAPDSGEIHIFGVPNTLPKARARVAFLPERFVPPFYLVAGDFLHYALKMSGRVYDRARAEQVLAELDFPLTGLRHSVRALSKGMTQKLGLAACFLIAPDCYVLDEPMSGLDPKARSLAKAKLAQVHSAGSTLFFTSHVLTDIEEVCQRMAVLDRGRIRYVGDPGRLREVYAEQNLERAFLKCIE